MNTLSTSLAFLILIVICSVSTQIPPIPNPPYPVPLPSGGRQGVHGWLILPWEQSLPDPNDPSAPAYAWFSHHVPEFWTDSPHDWQIIFQGEITPIMVAENDSLPIRLPYPPQSPLLVDEFTFTPPPNFSLNDLLMRRITGLKGVVYNGSFDTPYERYAISLGSVNISQLTTAIYLNQSLSIPSYPVLSYYSYPRAPAVNGIAPTTGIQNFYFAHSIRARPDFDQIIHGEINLSQCQCSGECSKFYQSIFTPGIQWTIPGLQNVVEDRLLPNTNPVSILLTTPSSSITCKLMVLEQIHCVLGPSFFDICVDNLFVNFN
eukprot:TRINITY_DN4050_c0_g1_i2.p1 TRINITY_DN4050_c0_g1~~TRINITY_DN4050_c0_g1_i2.p1  ORF type:complete len:318 (-),score=58.09 TRINITY_DN4050_c0_g1_i2:115-1068(-)